MLTISTGKPAGTLYQVSRDIVSRLDTLDKLACLTGGSLDFLKSVIRCAAVKMYAGGIDAQDELINVFREDIQDFRAKAKLPSSPAVVKKHTLALVKLGVFERSEYRHKQAPRKAALLRVHEFEYLMGLAPADTGDDFVDHRHHRGTLAATEQAICDAGGQFLSASEVRYAHHERLYNNFLGVAMRTSAHDPRRTEPFATKHMYRGEHILIRTSCDSASTIAHVDDQPFMRAIITYVCETIKERLDAGARISDIENRFFIDIVKLLKIMQLDTGGGNRTRVREALERLFATNFTIMINPEDAHDSQFVRDFGLAGGSPLFEEGNEAAAALADGRSFDAFSMRFITELDAKVDEALVNGMRIRRPRYFRISLHSTTFANLVDKEVCTTYIDNANILKVNDGILHLLYSWCCYSVSRNRAETLPHRIQPEVSIKRLRERIMPEEKQQHFNRRLVRALRNYAEQHAGIDWVEGERNEVDLCGYLVELRPDQETKYKIAARLNKNDPTIGHNSIYNKRLIEEGQQHSMAF